MPQKLKSPFFLIYFAAFINIVSFTMVFPLLPSYAKDFNASDTVIGVLVASFAIAQLFFSPLWGRMSDRFGRKPIVAVGLFGLATSFILFGAASNLALLFLGRILQGMFSAASLPAVRAYIADITTENNRVKAMGELGAALALGIILGPAFGGVLAHYGIAVPFYVAAILAFINFFFVALFLPESITSKTKEPLRVVKNTFLSLSYLWTGLKSDLSPLFLLAFTWSFALSNNNIVVPLLGEEKFGLNTGEIGLVFTVMGIGWAGTQFFLLSKITSFLGEHLTIVIGLALMALGFTVMPFTPPLVVFLYITILLAGLGSAVSRPTITALISKETKEHQGITMGIATAFEALGRLIGPLIGGFLFAYGMPYPFLFSGIVTVIILAYVLSNTHYLKAGHAT